MKKSSVWSLHWRNGFRDFSIIVGWDRTAIPKNPIRSLEISLA